MKFETSSLEVGASTIKTLLAIDLAKAGHSIYDLEEAMVNNDLVKSAELFKIANPLDRAWGLAKSLVYLFGGSSLLAGALGGAGAYGAYKGLEDTREKIEKADAIRREIVQARKNLEAEREAQITS